MSLTNRTGCGPKEADQRRALNLSKAKIQPAWDEAPTSLQCVCKDEF